MSLRVATPELIGQRVQSVLAQRADAEIIAVRAEPRWSGAGFEVAGRRVTVTACTSPLAVRSALADWSAGGTDGHQADELLVVVCNATDADLGADVLARLTPARVLGLEPWAAVASLFGVGHLDAAFDKRDGWIADALLSHVSPEAARRMTAGHILTVEVALDALAGAVLGADSFAIDDLVDAASRPDPFVGLAAASAATREGLLAALGRRHGPLGELLARIIDAGHVDELTAAGIAARAVYGGGHLDGGRAAGRLEARYGDQRIAPRVGAAFAQRCEETLDRLARDHPDRANVVLARAADLAARIEAEHPEASTWLPAGFDARVTLGAGVLGTLDAGRPAPAAAIDGLDDAVDWVRTHRQASAPGGRSRVDRLEMAARLAVWLATPDPHPAPPASFEDAAAAYVADGAWIDRARRRLWDGDNDPVVGAVYRRVLDAVVARRRNENQHFAAHLASWTTTPPDAARLAAGALVPVEAVAETVLAPLGRHSGLLLVVLDGCGLSSFVELAPQLSRAGFREITRSSGDAPGRRLTGLAALPTVTEVSRASLIAGRLDRGNQDHERRQFEANPTLTVDGRAAAFFHQNRLTGAAGVSLAPAVDAALSADGPAVVGTVINTIDDHLKRGTFAAGLDLDDLHVLVALLDAARTQGRTVIVTADHGHVLAQPDDGGTGTFQGGGEGGERWRTADRDPGPAEVVLRGERVVLGGGAGIIAPWDDDFRYGAKAGGYHGGATPEEVLVPVAVFQPAGLAAPHGWEPFTQVPPLWWDLRLDETTTPVAPPPAKGRRRSVKPAPKGQTPMFDLPPAEETATPAATTARGSEPAWLDALLASDVWKVQKGAAGRAQLPDDRVRAILAALVRRGGVSSYAAIAADTGTPAGRLPGFLAHLARVLNVDGYGVLELDAGAREARLSLAILAQQFDVDVTEP